MKSSKSLRIPYALAVHDKKETDRVLKVLEEHRTNMGIETKGFEEKVAKYFGKKYGIMVNSGSSANLLALEILNLPAGSEIITPLLTFSTTVAPIIKLGLIPVFVDVKEGQYLVAVNGVTLTDKINLYSLFQNTEGRQTLISVNTKPSLEGAKEFTVVPIPNEINLRLMNWVEENRRKVDSLSGGKIAYVYLPNTGNGGYNFFNRYFFSQLNKQAVIADDRNNLGGYAADYIVDLLGRNKCQILKQSRIPMPINRITFSDIE